MLIRAILVLLIVLNLGVAAWWLTQGEPVQEPRDFQPPGVPRLQLAPELAPTAGAMARVPDAQAPAPPDAVAAAPEEAGEVAPAPARAEQCFTLGPFADAAAAQSASLALGNEPLRTRVRESAPRSGSGFNVYLPASADRAQAQAQAARIGAAGFDDYLIINSGERTNAIALGRYGSRAGAERRQSALQAAGFAAEVEAVGTEASAWWLDVRATQRLDGGSTPVQSLARQSRTIDCAPLR